MLKNWFNEEISNIHIWTEGAPGPAGPPGQTMTNTAYMDMKYDVQHSIFKIVEWNKKAYLQCKLNA